MFSVPLSLESLAGVGNGDRSGSSYRNGLQDDTMSA